MGTEAALPPIPNSIPLSNTRLERFFGVVRPAGRLYFNEKHPFESFFMTSSRTECSRCGTCCKNGGPAFHQIDKPLIESGLIPASDLFTIRRGEPVYDNVRQSHGRAETDIIKIKNSENSAACKFYDPESNSCEIYENRPEECRILKCWDTEEIEDFYTADRLTRAEFIGNISGLWDIVQDHQQQCPLEPVIRFIEKMKSSGQKDHDLEKKVNQILQYDHSIRLVIAEKAVLQSEMLDFLFGRPIHRILESLGLKAVQQDNRLIYKLY